LSSTSGEIYDVCIVGGGIAGAGILQAAAAAGYRALLLESRGIAAGTSSRSSKLIHGGLRYLETMQFSLVRESLEERRILLNIAPDLVKLVPFYIPIYATTKRSRYQIRIGLALYALLGNLRKTARFRTIPRDDWERLDGLKTQGLRCVFEYFDGQTDDVALTRAVLASALELGGRCELPAEFRSGRRTDRGWAITYAMNGTEEGVQARTVVNAAGPWVEEVRARFNPLPAGFAVDLVQGTHIEIDEKIESGIYYTEATRDRRAVFTIPWKGRTMVGTTENVYRGAPGDVAPLDDEVEYLLETFNDYFPGRSPKLVDSWAGSRVLPRTSSSAFDRPRDVTLVADDEERPTLLSIYGGKLTGYRATSQKVLGKLLATLGPSTALALTEELPLKPVQESVSFMRSSQRA
jgi:glycerol-3-phosphate dehydrogenase